MSKTLVFEGCPTCERGLSGFGAPTLAVGMSQKELLIAFAQGGAVGGGSAIALDIIMPRIPFIKDQNSIVKAIITGGIPIAAAIFLYKKNPSIAMGIGVGGASVAAYKLIGSVLGKAGFSGFGALAIEETSGFGAYTGTVIWKNQSTGAVSPQKRSKLPIGYKWQNWEVVGYSGFGEDDAELDGYGARRRRRFSGEDDDELDGYGALAIEETSGYGEEVELED